MRRARAKPNETPKHWQKCEFCNSLIYYKELKNSYNVCQKCGFHMKITPRERLDLIADHDTFKEYDANLKAIDPLNFTDKKSYKKRLNESENKTNQTSATLCGEALINGNGAQLVIFDFDFMGGSLASAEGEKIARAAKRAIKNRQPLIIFSASGGARMQEGAFSLMQMSKTSAALKLLSAHNLPFISVLTNPTMGGVSASLALLGDLIIAEPNALIGFAGQRVIQQTIKTTLPAGFQRAEFLLKHGLIDAIIKRSELKKYLSDMINFLIDSPRARQKSDFNFKVI